MATLYIRNAAKQNHLTYTSDGDKEVDCGRFEHHITLEGDYEGMLKLNLFTHGHTSLSMSSDNGVILNNGVPYDFNIPGSAISRDGVSVEIPIRVEGGGSIMIFKVVGDAAMVDGQATPAICEDAHVIDDADLYDYYTNSIRLRLEIPSVMDIYSNATKEVKVRKTFNI